MVVISSAGEESLGARSTLYVCGLSAPAGWLNYDARGLNSNQLPSSAREILNCSLFPERYVCGNIVTGLPLADNSASGVSGAFASR